MSDEPGPLLQRVLEHQEALAARQARLEEERNVLVRLFRLMHSDGVITVEYGAIGSEEWSESLTYDEDVVLRRILDADERCLCLPCEDDVWRPVMADRPCPAHPDRKALNADE